MKQRQFSQTKVMDKGKWRREAQKAYSGLRPQDQEALRAQLGYPLRIKDFNERMCKKVISLAKELDDETNRNLEHRRKSRSR